MCPGNLSIFLITTTVRFTSLTKSSSLDRYAPLLAAVLLVLHAAVALWAASKESVTADEILYVTGGYYIDRHGDYRIQPENGVLPQRLHGLAALWTDAPGPALAESEAWRTSSNLVNSYRFFYETGQDHFPMLMLARALNTLFSIGAGVLVFLWARHLGGAAAGLAAVTLYAADPNILAHAALATSDMAAVFLLPASASAFWWLLAAPGWRRAGLSAVVFGLACVAKYSAVLLLPIFAGLLLWHLLADRANRRAWLPRSLALVAAHVAGAFAVIWLFHGFRYGGFSPGLPPAAHYAAPWQEVLPYIGWQGRVIDLCRDWHVLPEAFLYGYAWVLQSAAARAAFLAGDYSIFGWTSFFPLAFAWKTTLALLAGLGLALIAITRRWAKQRALVAPDLYRVAPLALFLVVYTGFSLTSHLNIGHRHLLPVYPMLFVAVGTCFATLAFPQPWRTAVLTLLLGAHVAASAVIAPHFLAFFNRLAGGPANGYRLLVDSSLDWGQDLPGLRDWLRAEKAAGNGAPVHLAYFGSGEPNYYGIAAARLPFVNGFKFMPTWYEPRPGLYCISATLLQQVYSGFGGEWTPALEREYRQLRALEPAFRDLMTKPASQTAPEVAGGQPAWKSWARFDQLRFARLCAQLRTREPDAMVGYSILIYRVGEAELTAALGASPSGH